MIFENKIIKGKGKYIPITIITNEYLERTGTNSKWIEENLGIKERRIEIVYSQFHMGVFSAIKAIKNAGLSVSDIGAVIVSCSSPSHFAPSMASQIIGKLGISVPAFDINAVCSGFVYALQLACLLDYNNVLVIATERYSAITDWESRDCVYFGDGAGAVVLSKGKGRIIINLYADGTSGEAFIAPVGDTYSIKGGLVYKKAVEVLPNAAHIILGEAGIELSDIDYIIPHQAGIRVLREIAEKINYPMDRFVTIMDKYANLASASIPVAMCEVDADNLLLLTIGSGWTWGAAIIQKQ